MLLQGSSLQSLVLRVNTCLQAIMALEDVQLSELHAKYGDSSDEAPTSAALAVSCPTMEPSNGSTEPVLPENVRDSDEQYWDDDLSGDDEDGLEDPADWVEDLEGNVLQTVLCCTSAPFCRLCEPRCGC